MRLSAFFLSLSVLLGGASEAARADDWESPVAISATSIARDIKTAKKSVKKAKVSCAKARARYTSLSKKKVASDAARRAARVMKKQCSGFARKKAAFDTLLEVYSASALRGVPDGDEDSNHDSARAARAGRADFSDASGGICDITPEVCQN